jgi:hypothetical protein
MFTSTVVARSSLRAITFVITPLRSFQTHIHRPYFVDVDIHNRGAVVVALTSTSTVVARSSWR